MFIDVSRRRSPSTVNLATCSRSLSISASVRSLILDDCFTPADSQIARARARPMPKIAVNAIAACWWFGMLMPAIRAMSGFLYPWRCLWRGSVQITRTTRLRRTILHLRQIFFTEAWTRMPFSLLRAEGDPRLRQIVGGELDGHLVAGQDPDVVHPHLPGDVPEHHVAVLQLHPEHRIGEGFDDLPLHLDSLFLRH